MNKCEYCGINVGNTNHICKDCRIKLRLVRKLQQMIRDTFEKVRKMTKRNYRLQCFRCNKVFYYTSDAKKYCPDCDIEIRRERTRKCMQKKRAKPSIEIKTISQVLREMKAYNEAHGTCLSYGQYVLMTEYQGVAKC